MTRKMDEQTLKDCKQSHANVTEGNKVMFEQLMLAMVEEAIRNGESDKLHQQRAALLKAYDWSCDSQTSLYGQLMDEKYAGQQEQTA